MRGLLVDPVFLVLLTLVAGLLFGLYRRALGNRIILLGVLLLYLLATPLVAKKLYGLAQADWTTDPTAGKAGAIVVLPASISPDAPEYGGDTVDELTLQRLRYAARLHRKTGLPLIVTGGPSRYSSIGAGEASRRALEDDFGVPVRWIESESRNTEEHARNCSKIMKAQGIGNILLVTHTAHMPRAQDAFERAGLAVQPAPTVFARSNVPFLITQLIPGTRTLLVSWYALRELVGQVWYRFAYS